MERSCFQLVRNYGNLKKKKKRKIGSYFEIKIKIVFFPIHLLVFNKYHLLLSNYIYDI